MNVLCYNHSGKLWQIQCKHSQQKRTAQQARCKERCFSPQTPDSMLEEATGPETIEQFLVIQHEQHKIIHERCKKISFTITYAR